MIARSISQYAMHGSDEPWWCVSLDDISYIVLERWCDKNVIGKYAIFFTYVAFSDESDALLCLLRF